MASGPVKQPVTEASGPIDATLLKDEHPHQVHCYYTVPPYRNISVWALQPSGHEVGEASGLIGTKLLDSEMRGRLQWPQVRLSNR